MTRFARVTLWLAAIPLLGFGALLLLYPDAFAQMGMPLTERRWRIDVRGVWGGLEIGLGVFLALCARRPAWARPGLWAALLIYGGTGAGHLIGNALDGLDPRMLGTGIFEIGFALAAWLAHRHEELRAAAARR